MAVSGKDRTMNCSRSACLPSAIGIQPQLAADGAP